MLIRLENYDDDIVHAGPDPSAGFRRQYTAAGGRDHTTWIAASPGLGYPAAVIVARVYTARHTLEIVEEAGCRSAFRYVSSSSSIVGGAVESADRADESDDVTPLRLTRTERAEYIVTRLPNLQTSDIDRALAGLMTRAVGIG